MTADEIARETCETCRFAKINWRKGDKYQRVQGVFEPVYEAEHLETSVQCRRHSPRMASIENQQDGWPWVSGADWCGEYQEAKP